MINKQSKGDSEILYYYCSTNVFLSILNNKTLWLSDMTKSNDALELNGYVDLLIKAMRKAALDNSSIPCEKVIAILNQKMYNYYCLAICFTDQADAVSQWQAYGDDGKGIAIGISRKHLNEICSIHPLFALSDVVYYSKTGDNESVNERIMEQIHDLCEICCKSNKSSVIIDLEKQIAEWASKVIHSSASFHKRNCFCGERETRFCYLRYIYEDQMHEIKPDSMLNNVHFRATSTAVIPYLALDISRYGDLFSDIIIGPCNTSDIGTIKLLLAKQKFSSCPIRLSETYYIGRK